MGSDPKRRWVSLDHERSLDYMVTPGQGWYMRFGPFVASLETADGLGFGFGIRVGTVYFGFDFTNRHENE